MRLDEDARYAHGDGGADEDRRELALAAAADPATACEGTDMMVIAVPANYDPVTSRRDTPSLDAAIAEARRFAPEAMVVVTSTVPVGLVSRMRLGPGPGPTEAIEPFSSIFPMRAACFNGLDGHAIEPVPREDLFNGPAVRDPAVFGNRADPIPADRRQPQPDDVAGKLSARDPFGVD